MTSFIEVGYRTQQCGRTTVRVLVPGKKDVLIYKGSVKKILFGSVINTFKWQCESSGEDPGKEQSSLPRGFNAVIITRRAKGRRMDVTYGLEA